ncbi:hypothetical protein [Flavobacterium caeni]|nr:hypothetical protein [Flavobacterium caeni]
MDWKQKTAIGILVLFGVVLLMGIGVNVWIDRALPKMLREKNRSDYAIDYKNLSYSLMDGYIKADSIEVVPKSAAANQAIKSGLYATVQSVEIKNFKIWSVLFSDRIRARSITVTRPQIVVYKKNDKASHPKNLKKTVVAPFDKIVSVSDIYVRNADAKVVNTQTQKALLHAANVNLQLEGIRIDDQTLDQKIPFAFDAYEFSCDSAYYQANGFYHLTTQKIAATRDELSIGDFKLTPRYSRRAFVQKIAKEKDLFVVSAKQIKLDRLDWGFRDTVLFAHVGSVQIDKALADIYRAKMPPDDLSKKPLYNKLLRDLDFDLKVDTLRLRQSLLAYEEEKSFGQGSGKLIFDRFDLTATHICSGFRQKKLPDLKIDIDCRFMATSPMHVEWKLNVLDKSDGFNIRGRIKNVDAARVNAFTKPYLNATTEGTLNEVFFNFTGNDVRSHGEFAIKYDDFKVTVYQQNDRSKKNKFLTAVGNLFVKNDTKGQVKATQVEVERIPEKSFYNFFWRNIAQGLLQIFV